MCLKCIEGTHLFKGSCHRVCPYGTYGSESVCLNCANNCSQCASNRCFACDPGYYPDGAICRSCAKGCSMCSSQGECQACAPSYHLAKLSHGSSCWETCPRGTYIKNGECQACSDPNCASCPNNKCETCKLERNG